ncbi:MULTISPECIES: hypothetical protein [unclassified Mycobacterium]|uniref:hypothetical protein n=1 Tax=unclassified Mycobacterium TaxID=2642494 RepID=UPI00073FCA3D|nr:MULTISPECIES: hypothetical protein [unclassified Mycobacterium]KUH83493.1 hypothetical protein AU186_15510 [Mycobacterium sp. GA-1999]KUH88221.1 hypothetical protein AU185_17835 [Mycobacterium sp. GA-0227b]
MIVEVTHPEESPGFKTTVYTPPCPKDADDVSGLAWEAGVVAYDFGYPIAVIVEDDGEGDGQLYGFQFHWTSADGHDWQHSVEPRFTLKAALEWLEAVAFTSSFLRDRQASH